MTSPLFRITKQVFIHNARLGRGDGMTPPAGPFDSYSVISLQSASEKTFISSERRLMLSFLYILVKCVLKVLSEIISMSAISEIGRPFNRSDVISCSRGVRLYLSYRVLSCLGFVNIAASLLQLFSFENSQL